MEKNCRHMYSRGIGEPRPRLCEHCKEPEVCRACETGKKDLHMCCKVCTGRELNGEHSCIEYRDNQFGSPTVQTPPLACIHNNNPNVCESCHKLDEASDSVQVFVSPSICIHDTNGPCHICFPERAKPQATPRLNKWDKRFIQLAKDVSEWSKDKNTKTGAVIVHDEENTELTMGYNGFPRGANDDDFPQRYERPDKYFWTEHAERNAIYKAARLGININGSKMYCTYFPCADCSRAIIQAGIKKVYVEKPDFSHHKWGESWGAAHAMLIECGVELIWTND